MRNGFREVQPPRTQKVVYRSVERTRPLPFFTDNDSIPPADDIVGYKEAEYILMSEYETLYAQHQQLIARYRKLRNAIETIRTSVDWYEPSGPTA